MEEYRVGNFVYREDENDYEVSDVQNQFTFRAAKSANLGAMLSIAMSQKGETYLHLTASIFMLFASIMPDKVFFTDVITAGNNCLHRNMDAYYGMTESISKEEDDKILNDVRAEMEEIEKMREE